DTRQRACFNHLIETQPGFEACAKFLERYQRANARAIRTLDRIRKAAGKPKLEVNQSEVEKDYPTNTATQPPPPPQQPDVPKWERRKVTIEVLLILLLVLSLTIHSCQKHKNEGFNPELKITSPKHHFPTPGSHNEVA